MWRGVIWRIQFVHIHHGLDECVCRYVREHVEPNEHVCYDNFCSASDGVVVHAWASLQLVVCHHQEAVVAPRFVLLVPRALFVFVLAFFEVRRYVWPCGAHGLRWTSCLRPFCGACCGLTWFLPWYFCVLSMVG